MAKKDREPIIVKPEDIDPRYDWKRPIMALGPNAVDFEERIDFRRLHRYGLDGVGHLPTPKKDDRIVLAN